MPRRGGKRGFLVLAPRAASPSLRSRRRRQCDGQQDRAPGWNSKELPALSAAGCK